MYGRETYDDCYDGCYDGGLFKEAFLHLERLFIAAIMCLANVKWTKCNCKRIKKV